MVSVMHHSKLRTNCTEFSKTDKNSNICIIMDQVDDFIFVPSDKSLRTVEISTFLEEAERTDEPLLWYLSVQILQGEPEVGAFALSVHT